MYRGLRAETETRATPATYADERNLRLKRREFEQVKSAETLDQMGKVCVPHRLHIDEGSSTRHPVYSRRATGCANTFTRNWGTLKLHYPLRRDASMPACRTEGGGSIVAKYQAVMGWT